MPATKNFLRSLGFIFIIAAFSFGAGILTGWGFNKPAGSQNYSDQIKRIFDAARNDIIAERGRLDGERSAIGDERRSVDDERKRLERERDRFEDERNLNRSDREDLLRLEFLINDSIEKLSAGQESPMDSRDPGRAGSGDISN